jgi:hypothetical protein
MGNVAMCITTAAGALDVARTRGFIEAVFTPTEPDPTPTGHGSPINDLTRWGHECDTAGRHGIIVGRLPDAYFVMFILRESPPEQRYALEAFREVFRRNFNCEPKVDTEVPDEEVWVGPQTSRDVAIAVACELVELDRAERDEDLEMTFGIMTS